MTRKRRNFSKATIVAAFTRCDGRCEGKLESGARCNAVLVPGRWQADHDDADGLTGEPTLENARCLCSQCHSLKTARDVEKIARAKRQEAAHIGARTEPARKIETRGFAKKPKRAPREALPPRRLFERIS